MRKVKGYLSNDNMFFDTKEGAVRHDAELMIISYCIEHNLDQAKVISIIEALAEPIQRYVNAHSEEASTSKSLQNSFTPETHLDQADSGDDEELEAVLQQPLNRP